MSTILCKTQPSASKSTWNPNWRYNTHHPPISLVCSTVAHPMLPLLPVTSLSASLLKVTSTAQTRTSQTHPSPSCLVLSFTPLSPTLLPLPPRCHCIRSISQ
uniref:Uncharacterized protein n=1 Tax=Cacopsylla melanoneura TaxID=428564 RepID=A0A8D8RE51_9HEMI